MEGRKCWVGISIPLPLSCLPSLNSTLSYNSSSPSSTGDSLRFSSSSKAMLSPITKQCGSIQFVNSCKLSQKNSGLLPVPQICRVNSSTRHLLHHFPIIWAWKAAQKCLHFSSDHLTLIIFCCIRQQSTSCQKQYHINVFPLCLEELLTHRRCFRC